MSGVPLFPLFPVMLSLDAPSGPVRNVAVMHGVFVGLFTASGLMFRHASLAGAARR